MAKKMKKIIGFDLTKLKPIKTIKNINVPTLYIVSVGDILSRPNRVLDMFYA